MYTSSLGAPAMDVGRADGLIRCSLFSKVTGNISRFGQTGAAADAAHAHAGTAALAVTLLSAELAKDPVSTCKGISIWVSERYELEMNCHGAFLIRLPCCMELRATVTTVHQERLKSSRHFLILGQRGTNRETLSWLVLISLSNVLWDVSLNLYVMWV